MISNIAKNFQKLVLSTNNQGLKNISKLSVQYNFSTNNDNNNNDKNNNEVYKVPYNYNREQFKKYTKKVDQALKEKEQREEFLRTAEPIELKPRRRRRQYDKPKYDLDITSYGAWRVFEAGLIKNHENGYPVVCKIPIAPKDLVHVFGKGCIGTKNQGRSTREYDFEDNDGSYYLLYDWKATTVWNGENIKGYDYENQEDIYPKKRKVKYPTEEEFWNSSEIFYFRVNCSKNGDFRKFKKWIMAQINEKKSEPSLDEIVKQKFGELNNFDNFQVKDYKINHVPPVFTYNKASWDEAQQKQQQGQPEKKQKKKKDGKAGSDQDQGKLYHDQVKPAKRLDDKYLLKEEEQQQNAQGQQ